MSSICKTCGGKLEWGFDPATQRYVPLEPQETDAELAKTFVDADGVLRADHRDRHTGKPTVVVTRLERAVPAAVAEEHEEAIVRRARRRRREAS